MQDLFSSCAFSPNTPLLIFGCKISLVSENYSLLTLNLLKMFCALFLNWSAKGIVTMIEIIPVSTNKSNSTQLLYTFVKIKYLANPMILALTKSNIKVSFQYHLNVSPFKSRLWIIIGVIKKHKVFIIAQDKAPPTAPYFNASTMVSGIIRIRKKTFW